MIPLWLWGAIGIGCLLALAWHDERQAKRNIENFRAVEDERLARQATAPLGNAERIW